MPTRVAYLGPEGTYAEKAAWELTKLEKITNPEFVPCLNLHSVFEHITNKHCVKIDLLMVLACKQQLVFCLILFGANFFLHVVNSLAWAIHCD